MATSIDFTSLVGRFWIGEEPCLEVFPELPPADSKFSSMGSGTALPVLEGTSAIYSFGCKDGSVVLVGMLSLSAKAAGLGLLFGSPSWSGSVVLVGALEDAIISPYSV
jgi:hypothetical protein